jgi:hypothetical protein
LQGKTAALLNKGRLDAEALLAELSSALNAMNGRQSSPPRAHIQPAGAIEHAPGR